MNKRQRNKARKMKSLIRRAKRNGTKEKCNNSESDLNSSEAKYLHKTQEHLLNHNKVNEVNEKFKETTSFGNKNKAALDGENLAASVQLIDIKPDINLINKRLPKELIIRIFSFLDIVSLCRSACVSKYWNTLALDGSNWQYVDLFNFQTDVSSNVVENLANRCNLFLKAIRLENCRWITDDSVKALFKTCENIEILNLKQCLKLTDLSFIEPGQSQFKLTTINFESCLIGDRALVAISKGCPNLEAIDLSWCKNISSDALKKFAEMCIKLKYFSCRGLVNMTNEVLRKIANTCANLSHLNINNCSNISDDGLIPIASLCPLKSLSASNCSNISNSTLHALGQNCSQIRILEVSCCINLSDAGFVSIAKGCQKLERIDLEECIRITDLTVLNLVANCYNLRHLSLSRCELITGDAIRELSLSGCATLNKSLQVLELDNCPLISDASLKHLYSCQSLTQLELYDCQSISKSGIRKLQNTLPNCRVHAYFAPSIVVSSQRPGRSCNCCTIL